LIQGRYVKAGAAVFALIVSDTFRVEGYFEETKLQRIRIGDDATVKLIGDARVLSGHVESIAYGIEDQIRAQMMARGLHCITRYPDDEPHIVEGWL
jgi:multidrug resistance efflux pump